MESPRRLRCCLSLLAALMSISAPSFAQCQDWKSGFDHPGVGGDIHAMAVFDDGSGPNLIAGGVFTAAGGVNARRIAKWDGTSWSPLESGLNKEVLSLAVFDDGTGPALFAGGLFTNAGGMFASYIAQWDGTSWSTVGTGTNDEVRALAVFDDGTGPALFAGGTFTSAGGVSANRVAKWDGVSWSSVGNSGGSGLNGQLNAMVVFDDGTGPALFAGGHFTAAGGVSASRIAKWDGATWSPVGNSGGSGVGGPVNALAVFDDGTGPALFAGGYFTTAGGVNANRIAKWDGSSWSALGGGVGGLVNALAVFNDGTGPALFAGGDFPAAGSVNARNIARWDGLSWTSFGDGVNDNVNALAAFDEGTGPALFVGGEFTAAGSLLSSTFASHIAKWTGTSWFPLGKGIGTVGALEVFDDGTGPALFAGGDLFGIDIAKWDGTSWSALPFGDGGFFGRGVYALATFDDGTGPSLFAGGGFIHAGTSGGSVTANGIAKWNGTSWSKLDRGVGYNSGFSFGQVFALAVFDDGTGPALFAGGAFDKAGSVSANHIAKWDGTSWSSLGSGLSATVRELEVFDDGTGPALFAGGDFMTAGGVGVNRIAKWDGVSWSAVGIGHMDGSVLALEVFDDGTGPALVAGGGFTIAGGMIAKRIAKWDGTSWSALGSGMNNTVVVLSVFDDGTGPALFAGGNFTTAGGVSANCIAKWDGTSWSDLGGSIADDIGPAVYALAGFNDGADSHADLYMGGEFDSAGGVPSSGIAQWFGGTSIDTDFDGLLDCTDNCPADFNPGQEDCDSDGLGDLCAIASGASMDANFNGLPDECEGSSYCTGKMNSLGCVPFMSSSGFASATSQNAFQVMASDCLPNQIGLLLYGYAPSTLSFHGGTLCVNAPKVQFPAKLASPTGSPPCSGILHSNLNKRIQSGTDPMLTAGAQVYVQWRQRDPNDPTGFGDSLTNGLTFVVQP